jgi:hypothetical protein
MQGMKLSPVTLTETMSASYLLAAMRDEKNTTRFKKFGAHQHMIIMNASTVDVNLPIIAPTPSLIVFLDLKIKNRLGVT